MFNFVILLARGFPALYNVHDSKYALSALLGGLLIVGFKQYVSFKVEVEAVNPTSDTSVSSDSHSSIWDHLRANFKLNHYPANPTVKKTPRVSNKNYELATILERGAPYLHFIAQD